MTTKWCDGGAFTQLCDWLDWEGNSELYILNDLCEQMVTLAGVDVSLLYTKKYLRQLLKECYTDCIYFASQPGSCLLYTSDAADE